MLQKIILFFFILYFFSQSVLHGQSQPAKVYGADELGSTHVYAIAQRATGEMWFLTQQGVAIYDGANWNRYPSHLGLPNTRHSQLLSAPDSSMWLFGHCDEVWVIKQFKKGQWFDFPIPPGLDTTSRAKVVVALKQSDSGIEIVLAQKSSYFHYNGKWQAHQLEEMDTIRQVGFHKAAILLMTRKALYARHENKIDKLLDESSLPDEQLNGFLFASKSDSIFLKGNNWLGVHTQQKFYKLFQAKDSSYVHFLQGGISLQNGMLFFTLSGSPYVYNLLTKNMVAVRSTEGSLKGRTNHLLVDRQQNLWAASERGVFKFNSLRFTNYTGNIASQFEVTTIAKWNDNQLLLGHNYGYSILNNGIISKYALPGLSVEGMVSRALDAVIGEDGLGYLAFEGFGLVRIYPSGKWERIYEGNVVSLLNLGGKLYFSTNKAGIGWLDYRSGTIKINTRLEGYFRRMYAGENDKILLLAAYGILEVDTQLSALEYIYRAQGRPSGNLFSRLLLPDGRQIFGSMSGLQEWDGTQLIPATLFGQTIERPVYALHRESGGRIWAGLDFGVTIFEEGKPARLLQSRDGLAGNEVNRNALVSTEDGQVYIGTDKGLSIYSPDMDIEATLPPIPQIYLLLTSQDEYQPETKLQLPANEMLEIYFCAASFYDETSVIYRFRLKGLEDEWRYVAQGPDNHVRYSRLPSGEYTFELQAKEAHSPWSSSVFVQPIQVLKPFYFSPWFIGLAILLLVAIGSTIQALVTFKSNEFRLKRTIAEKMATIEHKEAALKRQNAELIKANKELDSFIHSVSHDLKSPLSSMRGLLHLAMAEKEANQKDTFIGLADKSLDNLDGFIQDIIDLSRNTRIEISYQKIDIEAMVKTIFAEHQHNDLTGSISLRFATKSDQDFFTDEKRLRIILNNLVSNAVKYRNRYIDDPFVAITCTLEENKAILTVSDNGIGIEEDKIGQIFDIFFRATDQQKGSGLGLYILKETLEKLGGEIKVTSQPNRGTTFTIILENQKPAGEMA